MYAIIFDRGTATVIVELRASETEVAAFIARIRTALDGDWRSWSFAAGTFEVKDVGLGEITCFMLPDPAPSRSLRRVMDAIFDVGTPPGIRRRDGASLEWHDTAEAWREHAEKLEPLMRDGAVGHFCILNASPSDDVTIQVRRTLADPCARPAV